MDESKQRVIDSFDKISQIENKLWNHNNHYYKRVIGMIKSPNSHILDVGCGDGDFLSFGIKNGHVCTGVDFSPGMIKKARSNSDAVGCKFICGDIYDELPKFAENSFDAVFSFATMHHLEYEKLLPMLERVVKKQGVFCIVDILQSSTLVDYLLNALAIVPNIIKKRIVNKASWQSRQARELWDEHGELDTYLKYSEIRDIMDRMGYRYKLQRLLYFRYMLTVTF